MKRDKEEPNAPGQEPPPPFASSNALGTVLVKNKTGDSNVWKQIIAFGRNQLLKKMHLRNFGKNMIENVVFDSGTVRRIQALNAVVYYELFFSHTGSKKAALLVYTF